MNDKPKPDNHPVGHVCLYLLDILYSCALYLLMKNLLQGYEGYMGIQTAD